MLALGGTVQARNAQATSPSWTTDHRDPSRAGNDTGDPSLGGPVSLAWTSDAVSGQMRGEPLFFNGLVFVATANNNFYAFNAATGHIAWQLLIGANLPPVPLSELHAETGTNCGNIDPLGITGTPVIDRSFGAAGTLFAVAEIYHPGVAKSIEHQLIAIDLASHVATSRNIDPAVPGFGDGQTRGVEQQRGALNLAGGRVIVPYGGLAGDCGNYHGFVVSSAENLTGPANTFEADINHREGGVWAASGAAVDGNDNVYVATGNGSEPSGNANYALSDGVIKLAPTMGQPADTAHYFAPDVWHADNDADADLGSMTPTLIPRPGKAPLVFQTGKQHIGYLLDGANLGGIGGQLFPPIATEATDGHICDGEAFGGTAYANGYVYVPCSEGLRALTVDPVGLSFSLAWGPIANVTGPPIVAGGRVWTHGAGILVGLNATTGAQEVSLGVSTPYNFGSPSAGGGRLYFASDTNVVAYANPNVTVPPPPVGGTNLYGVLLRDSGSGGVEVHGLAQQTHYAQFMLHAATAFGPAVADDWQFFVAPFQGDNQPDLIGVHLRNTSSGRVEVHVLSAVSGYSNFILHTATPLGAVPAGKFQFALGSLGGDHRSNLFAIALNNTSTSAVEVHALGDADGYRSWVLHSATAFAAPLSTSDWQFRIGDPAGRGDLVGISHVATSSGRTEVHSLARAGGYTSFTIHSATPLAYTTDSQFAFALGDHDNDGIPDVYAIAMNGTGSGMTEVHILAGSAGYTVWSEHAVSGSGPTDTAHWQFSAGH